MDKVYTPEIVPANPFPGGEEPVATQTQTGTDIYTPTTTKPIPLPKKKVAVELLSTALNTRSKKILQEFDLEQSGGIKVGNYEEGVSGDLRITPNGITARNVAGQTTFAIDGSTGDATFAGELRSGTLISGEIILGDGSIVLDDIGLVSTTNFLKSITSRGISQDFTTTSYVDLNSSSQTFTLLRSTLILFIVNIKMHLIESAGNTGDAVVFVDVDGNISNQGLVEIRSGHNSSATYGMTYPVELSAGEHTVKLKARLSGIYAGAPILRINEHYMSRIHLGS